jgi:hypothetical protein
MQKFVFCHISDCKRNAHRSENGKLGYCSMHYQRFKRHGNALIFKRVPSPALDWIEVHKNYDVDDCLRWPFHVGKDGYGRVHYPNGPLTTASRVMCTEAHGEPPSPKHEAAHSCGNGNKACVNPRHLYWATSARNHADKLIHGTHNRGERQGSSRLTDSDIVQIRELLKTHSQATVAKFYRVDPSHISNIARGTRWGWLTAA